MTIATTGQAIQFSASSVTIPLANKISIRSGNYTTVGQFIFGGTESWGSPVKIMALCGVEDATSLDIRIYDVDNATVICEKVGVTNSYPSVIDFDTISNLPLNQATWEFQIKRNAGLPMQKVSGSSCSMVF